MSWILNEEAPLRVQLIRFHWRCSILLDGTADEITVNIYLFLVRNAYVFDGNDENADSSATKIALLATTD